MLASDPEIIARGHAAANSTLLPARSVWERYDVTSRTLDRWVENLTLGFPRPIVINRRRYFRLADLEAWERSRAAVKAA